MIRYLSISIALPLLLLGCGVTGWPPSETSTSSPITVKLEMSKAPRLNEPVMITCTVISVFSAPNSVAQIELPSGATLIDGNLSWQGDLEPGSPVHLSGTIKFIEEGQWIIKAFAKHIIDDNNCWGDGKFIYVTVTKYSGKYGFTTETSNPAVYMGNHTGDFASPLNVELSLSNAPALNQTAVLTCKAFSLFGVPGIIFQVYLPEGLALVDGNLSWQGSLAENQSFELRATVKAIKTGTWIIEAYAKKQQPVPGFTHDRVGQMGRLYLTVGEDMATVSEFLNSGDSSDMCIQLSENETPLYMPSSNEPIITPQPSLHEPGYSPDYP